MCKISFKGKKLKWENLISLSRGALELLRKVPRTGGGVRNPLLGLDMVKIIITSLFGQRGCPMPPRMAHYLFNVFVLQWIRC